MQGSSRWYAPAMQPAAFLSWLSYGPTILLGLLAFWIIARSLVVPADVRSRPCCGACGHPTNEPLGERCTECGATLARAGVVTPVLVSRLRAYLPLALIAWTGICGTAGVHGLRMAQVAAWNAAQTARATPAAPEFDSVEVEMEMEPQSWTGGLGRVDQSKLNFRVVADLKAQVKNGITNSGTLEITIRTNGTTDLSLTTITLPNGSFTTTDREGSSKAEGDEFTEEHAKAALAMAGIDVEYKPVGATIRDLVRMVRTCIADPEGFHSSFDSGGGGPAPGSLSARSTSHGGGMYNTAMFNPPQPPEPWEMPVVQIGAGVMLAIYVAGLVLITWRHRRITTLRAA